MVDLLKDEHEFVWRMDITGMQMQSSGILADGERWNY
jgi:hypothetical protein